MNIQYSKQKQELRRDPVMESLLKANEFLFAKSNAVLAVGVAALVALGGYTAYQSMKRMSIAKAQESFGKALVVYAANDAQKATEALALVVENHGNSPQAAYSALLLGSIYMREQRYDEAAKWYEAARSKAGSGNLVRGSALEALGTCAEWQGDNDKAVGYLSQALKDESVKYRWPSIRWKLALISKGQGKADVAERMCQEIVSDTLAADLKGDAENLLAEIRAQRAM